MNVETIQQKINRWWSRLPKRKQKEWFDKGDFIYHIPKRGINITKVLVINAFSYTGLSCDKYLESDGGLRWHVDNCIPADCPQFWWKLEAYLGDDLVTIAPNQPEPQYELMPEFIEDNEGELKKIERRVFKSTDRRYSLIEAAIAHQKEMAA